MNQQWHTVWAVPPARGGRTSGRLILLDWEGWFSNGFWASSWARAQRWHTVGTLELIYTVALLK